MRKITMSEPVIVDQNTTEPILFGGQQFPVLRRKGDVLYIRFSGRKDSHESYGAYHKDPIFRSLDEGKTWHRHNNYTDWLAALPPLPNGDILQLDELPIVRDVTELPETDRVFTFFDMERRIFTVDEMYPYLGDKVAKEFKQFRIKAGTNEMVEEYAPVNWDKMPLEYQQGLIIRQFPDYSYKVDKNGTLWTTVPAFSVAEDGSLPVEALSLNILRSDDMGHSWDYVSTLWYDPTCNHPNAHLVEGFNENALEILDDGTMMMIVRTGSLHPFDPGDDSRPAPWLDITFSHDGGKTWDKPEKFYDFGIRPYSLRMGCGTYLMTAGRPDVYIRTCDDPHGKQWSEPIFALRTPEEDRYKAYYEYSCFNNGILAWDDHTAFLTYSDFQLKTPQGERAKSIVVRKLTFEE